MKLRGRVQNVVFKTIVVAFALGAKCECSLGGKKLDRAKLETLIKQMAEANALPAKSVTCPPDLKGKEGDVFECTVQMGDGSAVVVVTMAADFNANLTWKSPVVAGPTLHAKLLEVLGDDAKQAGITGADCGEQLLEDGEEIACKPIGGPPGRIDARLKGDTIQTRFVPEGP
jgi:hypothetical protein